MKLLILSCIILASCVIALAQGPNDCSMATIQNSDCSDKCVQLKDWHHRNMCSYTNLNLTICNLIHSIFVETSRWLSIAAKAIFSGATQRKLFYHSYKPPKMPTVSSNLSAARTLVTVILAHGLPGFNFTQTRYFYVLNQFYHEKLWFIIAFYAIQAQNEPLSSPLLRAIFWQTPHFYTSCLEISAIWSLQATAQHQGRPFCPSKPTIPPISTRTLWVVLFLRRALMVLLERCGPTWEVAATATAT